MNSTILTTQKIRANSFRSKFNLIFLLELYSQKWRCWVLLLPPHLLPLLIPSGVPFPGHRLPPIVHRLGLRPCPRPLPFMPMAHLVQFHRNHNVQAYLWTQNWSEIFWKMIIEIIFLCQFYRILNGFFQNCSFKNSSFFQQEPSSDEAECGQSSPSTMLLAERLHAFRTVSGGATSAQLQERWLQTRHER